MSVLYVKGIGILRSCILKNIILDIFFIFKHFFGPTDSAAKVFESQMIPRISQRKNKSCLTKTRRSFNYRYMVDNISEI